MTREKWILAAVVLTIAVLVVALAPSPPLGSEAEQSRREAVRGVLDAQVAAWNRGDLEGFMAGYWNSDRLTFFSGGDITRGWKPTLDRYHKRYRAEGKEMGRTEFSDVEIDLVGPDTAFVRGRWKLFLSKSSPEGLFTLRFHHFPEGWKIVHDHSSEKQLRP